MLSQWERWKEIISKYKILFTFISIALLLSVIFLCNIFIHMDNKDVKGIPTVSINKINKTGSESQTDKTEANVKRKVNSRKSENEFIVVV
ncbi:hypothetical protein [Staphylococcus xylosus]